MVATVLYKDGATEQEMKAVATTMLTSSSTLLRHYVKLPASDQYEQAQERLTSVLGKRGRPVPTVSTDDDADKTDTD